MKQISISGISYQCALSADGLKYELIAESGEKLETISPSKQGHTIEDVKDVVAINDIPCYVYQNDKGLYSLRPALNGSGMAIDIYCYDIDSWGKFGDFVKISCASCGNEWYMNVRQIPEGDTYEVVCPKCGTMLKRKR